MEECVNQRDAIQAVTARQAEVEASLKERHTALAILRGSSRPDTPTVDVSPSAASGPTIEVQRAAIDKALAVLAQAEPRLALCSNRAPVDRTILPIRVRVREYPQAAALSAPLRV